MERKKEKENSMKRMIVLLIAVALLMAPAVGFCANLEMLDEMTLGAKVQSQDLILTSDHIDIGAEIGAFDLHNSDAAKNSFYAMGTVTVKGWSIFNWKSKE